MILSIPIPEKGKLLIKVGQSVDFNTSLYEEQIAHEVKIIISDKIHVPSQKIFQYLKKVVGETVQKGEILAEKKSLLSATRYKSEWEGILKEINHIDGSILIEVATSNAFVKKAFFSGEIAKIEKGEVQLKVNKMRECEGKEITNLFGGKVFYLRKDVEINEESIQTAIVVAESISGYTQIKMEALGARGFITLRSLSEETDIPQVLFKTIKDYEENIKNPFPYCIVYPLGSKIVFYG